MTKYLRPFLLVAFLVAAATVLAAASAPTKSDDKPDVGPSIAAQSAADYIRSTTGADGAFIHAGFLKESLNKDDLSAWLKYPADSIIVLKLTGEQIRTAFELSVALYPESNMSFLQISGFEVTFKKDAPADHRIVSVTVNGAPLENARTYSVAMPALLAHGAVGYYRIWSKAKPAKELTDTAMLKDATMESVLKGKKATAGSPRWIAQS